MNGSNIAGGNPARGRVENDFYATPEEATQALMEAEIFNGTIWEPACGNGMMSKKIMEYNRDIFSSDLIDRGYGFTGMDFLKAKEIETGYEIFNIITNPPFNLFQEFAQKALLVARNKVALFGKLQALEGNKRATFLESSPLKTVYVFKKRINPLRNGNPLDENGKKWCSTMAFAWYVWEIGYTGKPTIE
jgi:hypothetical protein